MVYLLLAEGFEEIEAIGTVDILRRAGIELITVSISCELEVKSARNIRIIADRKLCGKFDEDILNGEMLILPGGGKGVENLSKSAEVKQLILAYSSAGKKIAAICAAPTLLGKLAVLTDKKATCFPSMKNELICREYSEEPVVVDGNIITSRGAGTTHLFAAKIADILTNRSIGENILTNMIY